MSKYNADNNNAEFIILGAGGSMGVPTIGNDWGDCNPNEPKNIRSRTAALIRYKDKNIAIDTGPDFKLQVNRQKIGRIDAVLYTHDHGDHTNGIDELRVFMNRYGSEIPVYGSCETMNSLRHRHAHMFEQRSIFYPTVIDAQDIRSEDMGKTVPLYDELKFIPFDMQHGSMVSTGFRIGDLAYCTDMSSIPDQSHQHLKGLNTFIVDSAGFLFKNPAVHANLEYIYKLDEILKPKRIILTALSKLMDYAALQDMLPPHIEPAFDQQSISIKF